MSAEDIVREFAAGSATVSDADKKMFEEQQKEQAKQHEEEMKKMEEMFAKKMADMQAAMAAGGGGEDGVTQEDINKAKEAFEQQEAAAKDGFAQNQAVSGVQLQLQDLMRKAPNLSKMCQMLDRPMLGFEVKLSPGGEGEGPKPKMVIRNSNTGEQVLQDPWEFDDRFNIVQDELSKVKQAVQFGTDYDVPEVHDPLTLLFDNLFKLGTAEFHLMEYAALMETGEPVAPVRNTVAPFNEVGKLEIMMTPIKGPEDPTPLTEDEMVDDPQELIGKPWTYQLQVKSATKLNIMSDETFVQYTFDGDLFCTEVVTDPTKDVTFDFKAIHHVPEVTEKFLAYLDEGRLSFDVFVNPQVELPTSKVSSTNSNIRKFLGASGPPVAGDATADGSAPPADAAASLATGADFQAQKAAAEQALSAEQAKVKALEAKVAELEAKAKAGGATAAPTAATPASPAGSSAREKELEAEVAKLRTELANAPQSSACVLL